MNDLISRADAIEAVGEWMQKEYGYLDLNRAERLIDALSALPSADVVLCKDCYWYDKGKNDCDSWEWCKRHKFDTYDEGFCAWATNKKQVTGKLKKPCDSLLTEDSEERKEQKSKLDLIRREDAIDAIDDAIDADTPQWAILRTKIGFLPSADAVQGGIVYCKDCRWYDNRYGDVCHNPRYGDGWANYPPPYVDEDYWCKDGERKGGDD